jgi:protein SCO1/2
MRIAAVTAAITAALAIGVSAALWSRHPAIGSRFTLTSADGQTVTEQTFRGRWELIYFGYTYCPDVCPTELGHIADALAALGPLAERIQPIFITVDPPRDTTKVVGEFVKNFDPRIIGLTGSAESIAAAAHSFGVYYARENTGPKPDDYVLDHSSLLYLMNPQGKFVEPISTIYDGDGLAALLKPFLQS